MFFKFKNKELATGDLISFKTATIPTEILSEVQASVITVENGILRVISTFLRALNHKEEFRESDISALEIIMYAKLAIPFESEAKFQKDELVLITEDGKDVAGQVIAAFEKNIILKMSNGRLVERKIKDGKLIIETEKTTT